MAWGPVDVLITGAAGFLGSALASRLVEDGATVLGLDLVAGSVPTVGANITDAAAVADVFTRYQPRKVVHAAARVDDRGTFEQFIPVNVTGTENVVRAAAGAGVERLIHVSSIASHGIAPSGRMTADSPLDLHAPSPYFATKARGEQRATDLARQHNVPLVVIRPGDVYGPRSEPWVRRPVELMRQGLPVIVGDGSGLIAHAWIDNVVDALCLALRQEDAVGRRFIITDGCDTTTYASYFDALAGAAAIDKRVRRIPKSAALAVAAASERILRDPLPAPPLTSGAVHYVSRKTTYAIDAAREHLGYEPRVSLEEGMAHLASVLSGEGS